jgi:hypothetical protein
VTWCRRSGERDPGPINGSVIHLDEAANDRIWTGRAGSYGWDTEAMLASRLKVNFVRKYLSNETHLCDVGSSSFSSPAGSAMAGIDLNVDMLAHSSRRRTSNPRCCGAQ